MSVASRRDPIDSYGIFSGTLLERNHRLIRFCVFILRSVVIVIAVVFSIGPAVAAQNTGSDGLPARSDTLIVSGAGPFLIRPFLVSGSVLVWLDGAMLASTDYRVDDRSGFLHLLNRSDDAAGQLIVSYRYIPIASSGTFRRWPIRREDAADTNVGGLRSPRIEPSLIYGDDQKLRRSGSITRGVTTGSARDVAIESGLRLQVDGQLVEGLDMRAALTDENTPILPEGTTQRLNDFDRVFIELKTSFGALQLGDVDGRIDGGIFGQFRRKLQGVTALAAVSGLPESGFRGGSVSIAGATSRGKFRVQEISVIDGVQGPYRLEGVNGERFIILLPGSEVVYVDGLRMQRGASSDYVVDYATGEITFTPRRMITADRRVSVEFQYTTQQFTRTLIAANTETSFGRLSNGSAILTIGATAIRETDGDQFSEEFGISSSDSTAISLAGDTDAYSSGATPVVFDPEALFTQYLIEKGIDSEGEEISIYRVISQEPPDSVQVYRVTFSRVPVGAGSYRRTGLITNGIAFEYTGKGNGEYDPVRPLPKPARHQLVDLRALVRPHRYLRVSGEWAASNMDLNRLSSLDSSDDQGTAYHLEMSIEPIPFRFNSDVTGKFMGAFRRYVRDVDFASFERIRPVEYARQWNIQNTVIDATRGISKYGDEVTEEVSAGIIFSDSSTVRLSAARLDLGKQFTGKRWDGRLHIENSSVPEFDYRIEGILSDDQLVKQSGNWIRQVGRVSSTIPGSRLTPYLEFEYEDLEQVETVSDSLVSPSIRFLESRVGAAWLQERYTIGFDLEKRSEKRIISGVRTPFDAYTMSTNVSFSPRPSLHTEFQMGYRVSDRPMLATDSPGRQRSDESFVVRLNGRWSPGTQGTNITWLYQAQTERSATLQEIYIRTGQERGEYVWVDENDDGVIQLEEFLPETTADEGLYIRTFLPSDSLEAITSVRGRLRLEFRPPDPSRGKKSALSSFLGGLNSVTVIDFEEKSRDPDRDNLYLLRLSTFRTTNFTLNGRLRLRQEIGLFRNNRAFDLNLTAQTTRSLTELAAGEEQRESAFGRVSIRLSMSNVWTLRILFDQNLDLLQSASFASRNYDILTTLLTPTVTWNVIQPLQLSVSSTLSQKRERNSQGTATIIRVPIDARYRIGSRLDVSSRFEISSVTLSESFLGRIGFEMTDGRGSGTSYLWRLAVQSNLSDILTATVSYDGRAPENRPVIHTARFQLSARF